MQKNTYKVIPVDELDRWAVQVLQHYGYSKDYAGIIANQLIEANLRAIDSHGLMRLPIYIERVKAKLVDPIAVPSFTHKSNLLLVEANNLQGQIAAHLTIEKMLCNKRDIITAAFIKHSSHLGSAGYFARELASEKKIGMVFTNAESCVTPYGGTTAVLGTNPISFAMPSKDFLINIDFSTSIVSFGEIFIHRDSNTPIPTHWGFDVDGNVTDDPHKIVSLRPMADYKGFGLAFMVDLLSGVLSGAAFGTHIGNMYKDFSRHQNVGHCIIAIDLPSIMDYDMLMERVEELCNMIRSSKRESQDPITIPGELSHDVKQRRLQDGIPMELHTWEALVKLGRDCGVELLL